MVTKAEQAPVLSERVRKSKESLITTAPRLSYERCRAVVQAYRETEGQPIAIRRAKVLDIVLKTMTIYIDDNPIVGTNTMYPKGCNPYPEFSVAMLRKTEAAFTSEGALADSRTKKEEEMAREAIEFFGNRSTVEDEILRVFKQRHPDVDNDKLIESGVFWHTTGLPMAGTSQDYGKVLNIGMEGVIAEAKTEQDKLFPGYLEDFHRYHFLQAIIMSCEAVIAWANRYAELAEKMAVSESDPARKAELERIARTCRWVPAKPARTFYEALQSFWFVHIALLIEAMGLGFSPGKFCQYMYPLYKKDKETGELTPEQAIELLELLYIKFSEVQRHIPQRLFKGTESHMGQNLNVGGLTRSGEDATNELDYLVVEAMTRIRLPQPSITLQWHRKLPADFLLKCVDLARAGTGYPAMINSYVVMQRHMHKFKISIEDARDFSVIACVDTAINHAQDNVWEGTFNMPKMLELALNNGKDPMTGLQLGPKTGEAEKFQTYEELEQAIEEQLDHFLTLLREVALIRQNFLLEMAPTPFLSALIDDCIKRGKDQIGGGARFSLAVGSTPVGMVDVANSLTAVKKLVFEEKQITLKQLIQAVKADFKGHEELQRLCLRAPKYGNDDDYADRTLRKWYDTFCRIHNKFNGHLNENTIRPYALSTSLHFYYGSHCGALPNGKKSRAPLTDASVSATPGTDRNGPTALLNSCLKALDPVEYSCNLLNIKFHPSALATSEGKTKMLSLIDTYFTSGGYHAQFNVVSADALREAQARPEDHRDLVVRVAGYSAFFVNLDPALQEEIIKRTEHKV